LNDFAKKLLESIEKPTFVKSKEGVYIGCNLSFEKFLGLNRDKIIGKTAFDIAPTALANTYTDADAALYKSRCSQIYQAMVATSTQMQTTVFHKTIFLDEHEQIEGFIGIIKAAEPCLTPALENPQMNQFILTARELSVIQFMAKGLTTKEIAKMLSISNFTASDYMKSIFAKLGVNNRVTALLMAQKLGLL